MSDDEGSLRPGLIVRMGYACYLFVGLFLTMLFRGAMSSLFEHVAFLNYGCNSILSEEYASICSSEMLVYRLSFALAVFFFLHWLSVSDLTCCIESKTRAKLQENFFTIKTILLIALFFMTFLIPNAFFSIYAYVCVFSSSFFLIMNVLFLVDFSYQWSDDWGERAEENGKWIWYLLIIAVGSFLIAATLIGTCYYLFVPEGDCNYHAFSITVVLLAALVYTLLSVYIPHGSVVPSGIVFLYTSAITLSTLRTSSDTRCNRLSWYLDGDATGSHTNTNSDSSNSGNNGSNKSMSQQIKTTSLQILFSSAVAAFTLFYATVSSSGNDTALNIGIDGENGEEEDADRTGHLSHYMFFHFVMTLGSMYLAMLATGWHVSGLGDDSLLSSIEVAFWVRQATVWIAILMYMWSLLAPYTCCRGRDYGFDIDEDILDFD